MMATIAMIPHSRIERIQFYNGNDRTVTYAFKIQINRNMK